MTRHASGLLGMLAGTFLVPFATTPGLADPVENFYRGKQMSMIIPSGVGGGYDLYGRFLARFLGKHIPGSPSVVVKNMPGAGGIAAANYLYAIAPRDA